MNERVIDTGITEGDLLAELAAEMLRNEKQKGEFELSELMQQTGKTKELCRGFLEKKIAAGELYSRRISGSRTVYGRK